MSESGKVDNGAPAASKGMTLIRTFLPKFSRTRVVDTFWALFGLAGPTLLQLLYVIAAARVLGADDFGQLMLCAAVATVASFFAGIGADGVAVKAIARMPDAISRFFGQAVLLVIVTALPVAIVATLVILWLSKVDLPLWLPVSVAISEILFGRVAMTCQKVFIALSQQRQAAFVGMFVPFARLISALAILPLSSDGLLFDFASAYFVSTLIAMALCLIYTSRLAAPPKLSFDGMKLGEGVSFALSWVNASLQVECDKMILSFFSTPASVGVYSLASRLMDGAFNPPRALRISLQGRMMREGAKGHSAMYRFMLKILPISIAYGFFAWAAIAIFAPFVTIIFGNQYAELIRILPAMGALPLLRSIADIGGEMFIASDRVAMSTGIQLITTVVRLTLGIVMIRSGGIDGAVGAALLATALIGGIFWTFAVVLHRRSAMSRATVEI